MKATEKLTRLNQVYQVKLAMLREECRTQGRAHALILEYQDTTGEEYPYAPLENALQWKARLLAVTEIDRERVISQLSELYHSTYDPDVLEIWIALYDDEITSGEARACIPAEPPVLTEAEAADLVAFMYGFPTT